MKTLHNVKQTKYCVYFLSASDKIKDSALFVNRIEAEKEFHRRVSAHSINGMEAGKIVVHSSDWSFCKTQDVAPSIKGEIESFNKKWGTL